MWTVMCQKTMDIKPKHQIKPNCVRRTVRPRLGIRLLRVVSAEQGGAGHWRSNIVKSTIKKYLHIEKKRALLTKLVKTTKEGDKVEETWSKYEETSAAALCERPPPGAMAPGNTTQYLMDKVYEDLRHSGEVELSPDTDTTSQSSYDACLFFQQQDFETQYGELW